MPSLFSKTVFQPPGAYAPSPNEWALPRRAHLANSTLSTTSLYTSDVPNGYLRALQAVGWELIVIDYVDKVAANLFDNMAKKRFSNVFTKLRVLQMENVDRVLLHRYGYVI